MALNNLGLGFMFTAKDAASGIMSRVRQNFVQTEGTTSEAAKNIGKNFESFGSGMAILSVGLTGLALFAPATQMAMEFGHELGQIRTVIDEQALSTEAATEATMRLAAAYGVGPIQQAQSLYETISAGISDATKATELLDIANQFAVGGNTELAGSVDVLTSSVNTYSAQGLTAKEASDALFTAIAAGKTTAGELSQSLGEVAPTAQALGVSFDELAASIAALTVQGIKTPQAITGINAMLSNMAKPTSDAEKEAKRLGIQFNATALKTMGLSGVLGQLVGNTKVNNDTFTNLFGSIDGVKSALALTAQDGAKMNEILGQMESKAGATQRAFDIMANTSKFQANRLNALKDNALILIGQALEPMVASILKVANAALDAFTRIPKPIRDFMVQGFAAASAVIAVVGAVIAGKAALAMFVVGLKAAGISVGGLLATMAPAILIIGALIGVFYAFKIAVDNNLGGIGDTFRDMYDVVALTFSAIGQLLSDGAFSGEVLEELEAGNSGIENFAVRVFLVVEKIKKFLSGIGEGFEAGINSAWPVFQAFHETLDQVFDLFESATSAVDPAAAGESFGAWGKAGQSAGNILSRVATAIVAAMTAVMNIVLGVADTWDLIVTALDPVWDAFSEVGDAIVGLLTELGIMDSSLTGTSSVWKTVGKVIGVIAALMGSSVASAFGQIAALVKGAASVIAGVVNIIAGIFTGDWARVWKGAKQVVYGVIGAILGMLGAMVEGIAGAIDTLGKVAGKDLGLRDRVKDLRKSIDDGLKETLGLNEQVNVEEKKTEATTPPPGPLTSQPPALFTPSVGPMMSQSDPAISELASAVKSQANQSFVVPVTLMTPEGDILAQTVAKGARSEAGRNFTPASG